MTADEHLAGQWREWRHARISELSRPYGWTALVAQHWLKEGDTGVVLDGLPGTWAVSDGTVLYTAPASGENLVVDGEYAVGTVEIVPGRNQTYGHGRSVPVYHGVREVETIPRTTDDGDSIFAVRVRDPRESARKDFSGLAAYDYDPAWRVPARFTPSAREDVEQVTVETGVRETTSRIGVLSFELDGRGYELALIGKDASYGVQPVAHIRDLTSGKTTYGAGRVVELQFADSSGERIDWIDFNYLTALPCAFTNFVTCPLPPSQNHLDVEVLAGEKKPEVEIDRVLTFQST
ncbi:DUF1684 domain-containing protein [Streptomyces sp. AC495_CC817]|uniref:DUF1684 domain-containing protein n=1 Tax=Streptomyces sp. AC495_CC817 TaxID=2823900 RepID=UPI001C27532C|nr:DUF1684 domain-containing protein [Streptomyces sp. AC495_CC817]